jgi:hypothetical protein
MTWVRVDCDLPDNPKLRALVQARRWTPAVGLAYVVRFFIAVRRFAPTGDVSTWDDVYLGHMMGVSHARVAGLRDAMVATRFVDALPDGRFVVRGWMERNGSFIKDADRQRERRESGRARGELRVSPPVERHLGRDASPARPRTSIESSQGVAPNRPQTVRDDSVDRPLGAVHEPEPEHERRIGEPPQSGDSRAASGVPVVLSTSPPNPPQTPAENEPSPEDKERVAALLRAFYARSGLDSPDETAR